MPDGNLNEEVGLQKIREYVYYMETKESLSAEQPVDEPYFMGLCRNTAYYFYYKRESVTTLDHAFLATIQTKAEGYTIYADLCAIPQETLRKHISPSRKFHGILPAVKEREEMELKSYQKEVIADLARYLELVVELQSPAKAYQALWNEKNVLVGFGGMPNYVDVLPGVPHVCAKVPTGGGKTYIAASSLRTIFDAMPQRRAKAVVWLVPSEAILTQTRKALENPDHPYRAAAGCGFWRAGTGVLQRAGAHGAEFHPFCRHRTALPVCLQL